MKRLGLLVFLLFAIFSAAQTAPTLTAEDILEKNLEATGGRDAWSRVKTIVKIGTVQAHTLQSRMTEGPSELAEQSGSIRIYVAPPDRYLYYRSNSKLGLGYEGCYRSSRWTYVPMHGIHYVTGEYKNCSSELVPVRWSDRYEKIELKGTKVVNGRKSYQVRVTSHGQNSDLFFDVQTFLLLRSTGVNTVIWSGVVAEQTDYLDYGEVDGLRFAYTLVASFNGGQSRTHFGSIYIDAKIADSIFEPEKNNHDKK